jgi:hypothetical protein
MSASVRPYFDLVPSADEGRVEVSLIMTKLETPKTRQGTLLHW